MAGNDRDRSVRAYRASDRQDVLRLFRGLRADDQALVLNLMRRLQPVSGSLPTPGARFFSRSCWLTPDRRGVLYLVAEALCEAQRDDPDDP